VQHGKRVAACLLRHVDVRDALCELCGQSLLVVALEPELLLDELELLHEHVPE